MKFSQNGLANLFLGCILGYSVSFMLSNYPIFVAPFIAIVVFLLSIPYVLGD